MLQSRRPLIYAVTITVALVAVVALWRQWHPATPNSGRPTIAQAQAVVMPKSRLVLPAIKSSVEADGTILPPTLRDVIPSDATNVSVKYLTDANKNDAYMVIFDLDQPIQITMRIMMLEFGPTWQVAANTYTAVFGLLEVTGHGYDVQTQVSEIGKDRTRTVIRAHQTQK